MNLALHNPFETNNFPEIIEDQLEQGHTLCCAFNRRGTLLAGGCADGVVLVWDFDNYSLARKFEGHAQRPVTSVSWTRNSRHVISSCDDGTVIQWDVLSSQMVRKLDFGSEVMGLMMHPRDMQTCVVCLQSEVFLIRLDTDTRTKLHLGTTDEADAEMNNFKVTKDRLCLVASFDGKGDRVFVGTPRGQIHIIDMSTQKCISKIQVPGGQAVKSIVFNSRGSHLVVNCSDRVIRVFSAVLSEDGHPSSSRDFQDVINRTPWAYACPTSDGEHVLGAVCQRNEHTIHIWTREYGDIVKMLDGPKDGVTHLACHPSRPILCSCGTSGKVYIWTKQYSENWSAFAPDFKELEENEEYIEKEDEFDIVEEDEDNQKEAEEEELIDITTVEHTGPFSDAEDELLFIPTKPEADHDHVLSVPRAEEEEELDSKSKKRKLGDANKAKK